MPAQRFERRHHDAIRQGMMGVIILALVIAMSGTFRYRVWALAPTTSVGGPIIVDTTWDLAGSPYVMTSNVTVNPGVTLTIDPGVMVQGQNGTLLIVEGSLQALGTAAQPITFTSQLDSGPGQWAGLVYDGGGGALDHVTLRYGGGLGSFDYGRSALWVQDSPGVTLSNAQVYANDDNGGGGPVTAVRIINSPFTVTGTAFYDNLAQVLDDSALRVDGSSVVHVDDVQFRDNVGNGIYAGGAVTVTNTVFESNAGPGLRTTAANWSRAADLVFSNDEGTITGGAFLGDMTFPTAWGADFYNLDDPITVPAGTSLVVEPGTEFRGDSSSALIVLGSLVAVGTPTNPITFTSQQNSGPNQWDGIIIDGGQGELAHVTVRYAGNGSTYGYSALRVQDAASEVTLAHANISDNNNIGSNRIAALHISNSDVIVDDTTFSGNGGNAFDDALQSTGDGAVVVRDSTFVDNPGTGIFASSAITVSNTTFQNQANSYGMRLNTGRANITCASFLDNLEGIRIDGAFDDIFVGGSTFSGNANFAVNNLSGTIIDAGYNYWGDPSGPSGNGPGTGDAVSTHVLYDPWLSSSNCVVPLVGLTAANDGPTVESLPSQLSATVTSGTDASYLWDLGDGTYVQGPSVTHVYPTEGFFTATVTATNSLNSLTASTVVEVLPRPSFGGVVWEDLDGDGVQGPGEAGLGGATITAVAPTGTLQDTSAADGAYDIATIDQGWYELTAVLAGYEPTTPNPISLPLPVNGSGQVDFGLVQAPPPGQGRIAGRAFVDANGDGQFGPGESALVGVAVTLLSGGTIVEAADTAAGGLYSFDSLAAGVYVVQAEAPPGIFPEVLTVSDVVAVIGITRFVNLGFALSGSVSGSVTDADGDPLAGVLLGLEQPPGTIVDTAVTDDDGLYLFSLVPPGAYDVRLTPPVGTLPSDGQPVREIVVPSDGVVIENWILDTLGSLTVRVRTWASPSYIPLAGVDVIVETPGGSASTYTTNYDGAIRLTNLAPGLYTVAPVAATLPDDALLNPGARTVNVALNTAASANFTVDLARSITAYCQRNSSGSPPYGPAFPCTVSVHVVTDVLGTPPGTLVASVALPAGGATTMIDLPTGSYEVHIVPDQAVPGQETWPDYGEQVALNDGTHAVVRYPFNPTYVNNAIRGHAFWDKNLDGRRQHWIGQTSDEANLSSNNGLTVELVDASGALLDTTVTQQHAQYLAGWYEFTNLPQGLYEVRILLPPGYHPASPTTLVREVALTGHLDEASFGYNRHVGADVYGRVYFDNDADGHYHVGVDDPYGGITVTLRSGDGAPLASAIASPQGTYGFSSLLTGAYHVELEGSFAGTPPTILVQPVSLPEGDANAIVDFPLVPTDRRHRVLVFVDDDLDGAPDAAEQRIGNVKIRRYASPCQPALADPFVVALTDSGGLATYPDALLTAGCARADVTDPGFPPGVQPASPLGVPLPPDGGVPVWLPLVPPGTLTVQPFWDIDGDLDKDPSEPILSGATVTVAGEDTAISSHYGVSFPLSAGAYQVTVAPPGGMTLGVAQPFQVAVNVNNTSMRRVPMRYIGSLSGIVNSLNDDASFAGLTVELLVPTTGVRYTRTVGTVNNAFLFTNLPAATYHLRVPAVPPGYRLDGVPVIPYAPGASIVQDVTLVPFGDAFGTVYLDSNGNGDQGPGEPGTDAYAIFLLDDAGSPPQPVTVAADGSFVIPDLQPNTLYALATDLDYPGYGPPGASITEAPGWFSVDNQDLEVNIGILPWDGDSDHNVVLGQVTTQNGNAQQPIAGVEVGYFLWDDGTGCEAIAPSILGTTFSDVNGSYRLDTVFLPGANYYCLRVLDAPGFQQQGVLVVPTNMSYQTPDGLVAQPRIDAGKDLHLVPAVLAPNRPGDGLTSVAFAAFRDDNGNGVWDAGEQPLAGAGLAGALTGLDGSGLVVGLPPGEHTLHITSPAGFAPLDTASRVVFASTADLSLPPIPFRLDGALTGSIFVDFDGDGYQGDGGQERGLADVRIHLSGPVVTETTTFPDGRFRFLELPDGDYTLAVEAPAGFQSVPSRPLALADGGSIALPLRPLHQLSGVIYEDWDGDGRRLPDEPPVAAPVTVTLPGVGQSRLFGGHLLFFDVAEGNYTLTPGWSASLPVSLGVDGVTGPALALPAVDAGILRGVVWHDANRDGLRQLSEAPLAGVSVVLDGVDTAVSDRHGRFFFAGVADGSHTLEAAVPAGLDAGIPVVTTTAGRGAAVGIAARGRAADAIYLPLLMGP